MKRHFQLILLCAACLLLFTSFIPVTSAATCTFNYIGSRMILTANCTTDTTILVPHGFTLDGAGRTITAVDPAGGHFIGAIVKNGGTIAHVKNLRLTVSGLVNVCDAGAERLRGIMFEGASGSIINNKVYDVRQVGSGCQEGNSIEVRNDPFDGTHPNTKYVTIWGNTITNYMKTGIVANGDVSVNIQLNVLSSSANQANLAANGIQIGFGGQGTIRLNIVGGNSWCCVDAAATAILIYDAGDWVTVTGNKIHGNSDVGIDVELTDYATVKYNIVLDQGTDGYYDVGIGNYDGVGNVVEDNFIHGFVTPYETS
ncbi:MAG: right-handed parallel beta-helix repeat-containing protein [Anaerolineae bacterium]|nr:right-handed parallel beta-helix repeat-containing protein [Anaerolineae bacterium]